ncbi:MAG: glycosyltransferase family 4 protein [Patescibacteria group bacterium]
MPDEINQIKGQSENPKKRILFVITQSEFGGAQRFLYELTIRLDKEKYEILVAAGEEEKGIFFKSLKEKKINTRILKFLRRKINPFFDVLGIIELMNLINKFRPDYLHLNSSKAGFLGSIAGFKIKLLRPRRFKNLKIIYRIGGWSFNDPGLWWKKKIFILAEKMTAKLKDIIVVNNKSDYEQAIKFKIKPKKELKLIYNGIDALKIDFLSRDEARRKLPKADFIIGTIANFYPTKGLEYLIEMVKFLKFNFGLNLEKIKFLIIGDGELRKSLESRIKNYGLEKEVILLCQIPKAHKFMKAFDIFVLPSVKEGFPWVILEAMAAKVPIIATSVGAMPEIIENGKNGILVEPKNPQKLAEAIKYLIENERTRDEFGIQAHQTVLFKFPVEKMVNQIEELF